MVLQVSAAQCNHRLSIIPATSRQVTSARGLGYASTLEQIRAAAKAFAVSAPGALVVTVRTPDLWSSLEMTKEVSVWALTVCGHHGADRFYKTVTAEGVEVMREEETAEFWGAFEKNDLMQRCASLHQMRREAQEAKGAEEIEIVRRTLAQLFIVGTGIEVGAGSRPFPLPDQASCFYGDVRDHDELEAYFGTRAVTVSGHIDAQTLNGIPDESLDFLISAHVIEHLFDPLRALTESIKRLRKGGILVLAVPEMTKTWDRRRLPTTLQHLIGDLADGGEGTRFQAYVEHCRYVHPEISGEDLEPSEIDRLAAQAMSQGMDLHVHAWREEDFWQVIQHVMLTDNCHLEARLSAVNENIYVLRKISSH